MSHSSNNQQWQARREAAVVQGVGTLLPVFIDRAHNAELWDVEGNRYIDFASGIAVLNTGHNHPKVVAAVREQLEKFSHTCFQVTPYSGYIELAEKLNALVPGPTPKRTIFLSTGAEAVENAIKIARAHTGRSGTIAFKGGFHGRTMMGMALTGKVVPYKTGFGPFPGEVYHLPFPADYLGVSEDDALAALDLCFSADIEPTRVIGGEGEVIDLPREGAEAGLVGHHLAGEGHAHHGAAVEAPLEGDGAAATGVGAGDLDGVLHRLGAGGEEEGALGGGAGHQGIQLLRQLDIAGVGGDLEAGVAELLELLAHRRHHLGVVVAGVEHGDAGGKVDVAVALHVPQLGVVRPVDEDRQQGADPLDHGRFAAGLPLLVVA
jgi:hypothetical protein